MRRCKIALTPSVGEQDFRLRQRYSAELLRCAAHAGISVMPVILPLTDDNRLIRAYAHRHDAFVLTGGGDVDPALYGEKRQSACGPVHPERDSFEMSLLREITLLQKPVLGICRGMQMMNVFCEGTLWQDMPSLHTVGREHCTADKNGVPRHEILAEGWLARITGQSLFSVNSYHHQAVKDPGRNLTVCGRSRDGTAEAFIHRTLPFFCGVQWHPEIEPDAVSRSLLEAFLKAADLSASRRG